MNRTRNYTSEFLSAGGKNKGSWERLTPHLTEQYIYLFHITRYRYAVEYLRRHDNVLDVGCGTGYGTALLSKFARHVTGVDISGEGIAFAQEYYPAENLDYVCADWKTVFEEDLYDAIVSFEFLEHIDEQDQFVDAVSKQLTDHGLFIVSTPNARISSGDNPFHLHELDVDEFEELLGSYFDSVSILGQYVRPEFYMRQKKLLDYIEMQSFMPKWLSRIRRPYSQRHRQALVSELIGLAESDILITPGNFARDNAQIIMAVCKHSTHSRTGR
jgi:2-polyprenyl-3-methyl-5-hydroxy-6-metoxy-1,4-benzoquinol methylase